MTSAANGRVRFADADKKRLKSTVLELRRLFEGDLARELKRLGIDPGRDAAQPVEMLSYLSEAERMARRALDAALLRERSAGGSFAAAVEAVRREAAYTHLNRLIGLKCLELRGHLRIGGELTETVTCRSEYGGRPKWLWTLREREGRYRYGDDAEEMLWREGLTQACAVVTQEIRVLFDPADPYAQVWPSHKALREAVDKLNSLSEDAFRADELLGWVYQYFQSDEKDRVFEAARTQKKKISGPDIIPVTQLYTEHYMVDFLLQNSLGALWMEMYPDSNLKVEWPYYVTPATPHTRPRKPVKEWSLLDPCVGSGHFHVGAFDMYVQLYAEERRLAAAGIIPADWAVPEEDVAVTILERNLHGIDIDPRAVQLATLALYLKAKEAGLARSPRINIVAADASFLRGEAWARFVESFKDEPGLQRILQGMAESLADIRELGSLLRPEVELQRIVREVHAEWESKGRRKAEQALLFPELAAGMQLELSLDEKTDEQFWDLMVRRAEREIHAYVDSARQKGEMVEQMVAGEAERGFAFFDLFQHHFDVVCTNPPYMGTGNTNEVVRDFIARRYGPGKADLYAAFILRCQELTQSDGYVAMVTQQSWLFLHSFANLRAVPEDLLLRRPAGFNGLLRDATIETLAHLGPRSFGEISGEVVNSVLFTFRNLPADSEHVLTAFRLVSLRGPDAKAAALVRHQGEHRYQVLQASFLRVPDAVLAYWLGARFLTVMSNFEKIEDRYEIREGPCTGDDLRWLRYYWEIADHHEWRSFPKGGGYCKWNGLDFYTLRWGKNGEALKAFPGSIIPNEKWYFTEGLTYTEAAQGSLGVRYLAKTRIPGNKAPGLFPKSETLTVAAAVLNCRVVSFLARAIATAIDFGVGPLRMVPVPTISPVTTELISGLAEFCFEWKGRLIEHVPTERTFRHTLLMGVPTDSLICALADRISMAMALQACLHTAEGLIEGLVFKAYELELHDVADVLQAAGTPVGWYPILTGYNSLDKGALGQLEVPVLLKQLAIEQLAVSEVADLGGVRSALRLLSGGAAAEKIEGISVRSGDEGFRSAAGDDSETLEDIRETAPIPAETALERLSQGLGIHPLSAYWLLEELRREQGLVCPPELKQHSEDYFTVKILRMLGHRWPMQDQYEQEQGHPFLGPRWLDEDGIIPLTPGTGDVILTERLARFMDAEFGEAHGHTVEVEAGQILGWKPSDEWGKQKVTTLARWFEREFFRRHVSQFKRRPIAWHLASPRGAFQAIVYYHKFDKNRLGLLRARYVRNVMESLRHDLAEAAGVGQDRATLNRVAALEAQLADVQEFDARLQRLQEGRERDARIWCPWKSPAEQPVGWDPDINDGVRVNIAPVQRLGLLAADVLAAKDVKSLLAPEGRG